MKANELMIGDWVRVIPYKKNGRIYRIDYANGKGNEYVAVIDGDFDIGLLEPIPITPEILEKNGFKQDKKCPFVYETDDEDVIIDLYDPDPRSRLSKKDEYDKMVGIRLSPTPPYEFSYWRQALVIRANFVHELQHALKLCGIDKKIVI